MVYNISYAQNREDIYLAAFFPDVERGFYVDIGANHPVLHSVTKRFSLAGWRGINIEPIREHHHALVLDRPEDINLLCGVSDTPGSLQFRNYSGDGLSTFSAEMMSKYVQNPTVHTDNFVEYEVEVQTLAQIFESNGVEQIHFLKVDVEGYEYEALAGNDWARFRPEVLCIEANHIVRDWHDMLASASYQLAFFDGLNEYFVAGEVAHRAKEFRQSYESILMGPLVVHYLALRDLEGARSQVDSLRQDLVAARRREAKLSRELKRREQLARKQNASARRGPVRYVRAVDRRVGRVLKRWHDRSAASRANDWEPQNLTDVPADPLKALAQLKASDAKVEPTARPSLPARAVWGCYTASKRAGVGVARKSGRGRKSA